MDRIGRNDQCPCNSGKKYKNCHLVKNVSREKFTVKITESYPLIVKTGKRVNGKIIPSDEGVSGLQLGFSRSEDKDSTIEGIINPLKKQIPENRKILGQRVERLRHKIYGIKFHKDNFGKNEQATINWFHNVKCQGSAFKRTHYLPELAYECESFLFQVKSCLDVLHQVISMIFRVNVSLTYEKGGQTLINALTQNTSKELKENATEVSQILVKNKQWILDVVEMRDEVTHWSDLEGLSCFIHLPWNGEKTGEIEYPSMPDGKRVKTYMDEIFSSLLQLIKNLDETVKIT
ncbi:MAG: SEC-C domain-containing protein [Nitrosarchaeum sp.]|nr:SEC-C domain-containing protein [Nitrosarchaeum sp.]